MDSSNKRKLTDDETAAEQSSKHQKVAEKFDFLNGDTFDLNDDCCRLNCKRLNLDDLVILAASDERSNQIACEIFDVNHSKHYVDVDNGLSLISLDVLKYFGKMIKKLHVEYTKEGRYFNKDLDDAINKHCHETLEKISFSDSDEFTMFGTRNCFPNVKSVDFNDVKLFHPSNNF